MNRPSLRWTFLVPILVSVVVGFTVFAIYADRVERNNRLADLDAELVRAEQRNGANPASGQPPAPPPSEDPVPFADVDSPAQLLIDPGGSIISTGASGNPFPASTIEDLLSLDGFHTVSDENYRVRVTRNGLQTSVTALSLDVVDEATADFRRALALGGGIILALVASVVWLLVQSITRPIARITAAATRVAHGELDTDLPAPTHSREVAELADDLGRMLSRLRSTIAHSDQSAAEATQARDDMQRFLADMAHELRTPLTALKGYSDLYAGGMLDSTDDVDRAMSRIGAESERLYRLADDMLQLARQAVPDQPTTTVDVAVVATEVAADLRAANPGHRVSMHSDPGHHHVSGAPARIHQAILNLGANACHHSNPDDDVAIHVESDETAVVVRVIDHGPGVDPADRGMIFLPFFRADTSRSRRGRGGAGLGLALTKQIADEHCGTITVETTPGGGATFVLSLPARVTDASLRDS